MARMQVGSAVAAGRGGGRLWPRRHRVAAAFRLLAVTVPAVMAVAAAFLLGRVLPAPDGAAQVVLWWVVIVLAMLVALAAGERAFRDLLPLAALLDLELVFPAPAPNRLAMWRRRGRPTDLRSRIARTAPRGGWDPQTQAAVTVLTLLAMLAAFDEQTRRHGERVGLLIDLLAERMSLSDDDRRQLRWAAVLHDVASASVAGDVLASPGPPGGDDLSALRRHPEEGAAMIRPVRGWLGGWADAVAHHHERWDGAGYPGGLAGMQISLGGRMLAVADAFETMTSAHLYARSRTVAAARQELLHCAGTQFDPAVVRAFLDIPAARLARVLGPAARLAAVPLAAPALRRAAALGAGTASVGTTVVGALAAVAVGATGVLKPPPPARPPAVATLPGSPPGQGLPGTGPGTPSPGTPPATASGSTATAPTNTSSTGASSTSATSTTSTRSSTSARSSTPGTTSSVSASASSPPPPSLAVSGATSVVEGSAWSGTATVSNAAGSSWSGTVDFGDGTPVQPLASGTSFPLSHTYADEPSGGWTAVTVTLSGGPGAGLTASTAVRVTQFTPQVGMPPATTVATGTAFSGCGSFTDPSADTWRATVDYGDGGGVQPLALSGHGFTLSHMYSTAGRFTVTVAVTDDDGASGTGTTAVRVVNGGSRTAGGCPSPAAATASAAPAAVGGGPAALLMLAAAGPVRRLRSRRGGGPRRASCR